MNASSDDFNSQVIEEFRANGGRVGGPFEGSPLILVHHVGARSGTERVTPMGCFPQGDGRYVVVASNGGSPSHPSWYHNLVAHPRVDVEVGAERFPVVVEELAGAARDDLWPSLVAEAPQLGDYQATATRRFPVLMLTRQG
jgi:deazaflavin-dependent oxidoreductase (nitroreductase family)